MKIAKYLMIPYMFINRFQVNVNSVQGVLIKKKNFFSIKENDAQVFNNYTINISPFNPKTSISPFDPESSINTANRLGKIYSLDESSLINELKIALD